VLTDLERHCVVTTLNGRDSAGLRDYLQAIDEHLRPFGGLILLPIISSIELPMGLLKG